MAAAVSKGRPGNRLVRWLLAEAVEDVPDPQAKKGLSEQHSWWQVVCLTGVDYFSTLGYIPAIAALPMYGRVAEDARRRPAIHGGG